MKTPKAPEDFLPVLPPRSAYLENADDRAFIHTLPLAKPGHKKRRERLISRLVSERRLYEGEIVKRDAAPLYALVLGDHSTDLAWHATLKTLALQSAPDLQVRVVDYGGQGVPPADLASVPFNLVKKENALDGIPDDAFLLFLRPGDLLHPATATVLARHGVSGARAVVLSEGRYTIGRGGKPGLLRDIVHHASPDLLTISHAPVMGRNVAIAAGLARAYGPDFIDDAIATDLHLPLIWLASRENPRAVAESEVLYLLPERDTSIRLMWQPAYNANKSRYAKAIAQWLPDRELMETGDAEQPYILLPRLRARRIDVVIPFRDKAELTCKAMLSIARQNLTSELEVILVNNQSSASSLETIRQFIAHPSYSRLNARIVDYDHPFNHSRQCNLGVEQGTGDVVVFMNNDAELLNVNALETMAKFALLPRVATVGIRLMSPGGSLVCAGFRPRLITNSSESFVQEWNDPFFSHIVRQTAGSTFALAALSREFLNRLGLLDAVRFPNGYNDVEYCMRALANDFTHICLGHLEGRHRPGTSRGHTDETAEKSAVRRLYPELAALPLNVLLHERVKYDTFPKARFAVEEFFSRLTPERVRNRPQTEARPLQEVFRPGGTLVVISYYNRRSDQFLHRLLDTMAAVPAGAKFDVAIVVNSANDQKLTLAPQPFLVNCVYRENLGMNIGAWDYGWRNFPGYDFYLFLQDECYVVREGWLAAFLRKSHEEGVGLVGEFLNAAWDAPWSQLRETHGKLRQLPDHLIGDAPAPRVDVYLDFFRRAEIPPGESGRHLRSLVWGASRQIIERLTGFPIGRNYGECIAAEIGVSRKVESLGLTVTQVANVPFHFIRHREYNKDYPDTAFTHDPLATHVPKPGRSRQDQDRGALSALHERQVSIADAGHARRERIRSFWRRVRNA